ncbi:F5/8 type C domain [Chlamydia abortus]|nr:F5/8 type C domain [Chlamydia abortus]
MTRKRRKWTGFIMTFVILMSTCHLAYAEAKEPEAMRNLAGEATYTYSEAPHENYPDNGHKLTDGKYGDINSYTDGNWIAFLRGKPWEITIDLGENKSIGRIQSHYLYNNSAGIYTPNIVSYYVSEDGQNWAPVKHMNSAVPLWTEKPPSGHDYVWDGEQDGVPHPSKNAKMIYARYVKIAVTAQIWVFMDEIEIWGVDGKADKAFKLKPVSPGYLKPGKDTAGIRNMILMYNGQYDQNRGNWKKENIIPYISYVDENGVPQDWMYDGVLLLGLRTPDYQRDFGYSALLEDWKWYLDKTFKEDGELNQLNEAVKEAGDQLGDARHKVKVVIMIPNPDETISDFGDIDGDGVSESFVPEEVGEDAAYANRVKAVDWYMNQVKERWQKGNYDRLELVGMYWLAESVASGKTSDADLLKYTRDLVHERKQKFFWIPYYGANYNFAARSLGFDATALQPNHYFDGMDRIRVEAAAYLAQHHGLGIEIETDERMNEDESFRNLYIDYLNGGVDYGYMNGAFKAYYQGVDALLHSSRSSDPRVRELYDWTYQFVKGTYQKQPN